MKIQDQEGYREAKRAIEVYTSQRSMHMAALEAYVEGTQYDGLPNWFDDGPEAKPLWERAPCFVYPIAKSAIDSNSDLLFGEGRFPEVSTRLAEEGAKVTADGLSFEESETLDRYIRELSRQARFPFVCRQVFEQAQGSKSACVLFGVRQGVPFCDTVKALWCTPKFDLDGNVTTVAVEYPYLVEEKHPNGKVKIVAKLFRRVVDATSDVTMLPATITDRRTDIDWQPDPKQTIEHGMGFCPVRWYAHMKGCSMVSDIDGHAIHENLLDEIRALDFSISQRHRAALYAGDPQWTETGVDDDDPIAGPTGWTAAVPATPTGGLASSSNPHTGKYVEARTGVMPAKRKSPGTVWRYTSKDAKITLHCLPEGALEAISKHAKDLRSKICESMGVVFFDAEDFQRANEVSGRALEARKARQIERCDLYREDFACGFIIPAIAMLLRVVAHAKGRVRVLGSETAMPILKRIADDGTGSQWQDPSMVITWGAYIRPTPDDDQVVVDLATSAFEKHAITERTMVEKIAAIFGIEDVDDYLAALKKERDKRAAVAPTVTKPTAPNEAANEAIP